MDVQPQTHLCPPPRISKNLPGLLQDPVIKAIADKHGRTPAQVALRYQLQRGLVVLAKSFNEKRMRENLQVHSRAVGSRGWQGPARPLGRAVGVSGAKRVPLHAVCTRSAVFNSSTLPLLQGRGRGVESAAKQGPAGVSGALVSHPSIPSAAK